MHHYLSSFKLDMILNVFLQMFFYNVHMLPSELFDQNISFRVSLMHVHLKVLFAVSM